MYKKLSIANFKGFSGHHEIELAPITLLYGANSAGKSAILESLLLLSQSIRQASVSAEGVMEPLVYAGKNVDLGSFHATINGHNLSKSLELGLTYETGKGDIVDEESFEIAVNWDHQLNRSVLESCVYSIKSVPENTVTFRRNRTTPSNLSVSAIADEGLRNVAKIVAQSVNRKLPNPQELNETILKLMTESQYQNWSFLPGIKPKEPSEKNDEKTKEELLKSFGRDLSHREWRSMLEDRFLQTRKKLTSIRYIGPLRKSPTRIEPLVEHQATYVGNDGQGVASILYKAPDAVIKVNSYLTRMGIPYEVHVKRIDSGASGTLGELIAIQLVDKRSNVILSMEDVGFGISQILPLLVQLAVSKTNLVVIEQPELHLHPAIQANFGDLLIEGVNSEVQTQFLIETHSEHLLLRLQRRIRSGELDHQSVAVYYIDAIENSGSGILRLELDKNGEFLTPWPNGFFPERIDEILS